MQIRAMTSEAQDIPQFLHSIFSSPDLGSGAKENKCKRFCSYYRTLDTNSRAAFLSHLAQQYSYNLDTVVQGASHLVSSQERGEAFMVKSLERLRSVMTPRYQTLFQQIGHFDWGVKFLVDMRADVLNAITNSMGELDTANFHALSRHLKELFSLWFAVGFFDLERVTWTSPCDVVQKISDYEAVHPIRSWTDLRQRVGSYRRCYVFTHHCMPREPIVVLHTALTSEISNNIHNIIHNPRFRANTAESQFQQQQQQQNLSSLEDEEDPSQITTAVFYSITSTQKGLQGVELGNYLIKSVVRRLQSEFPHLAQFSSLSPIPGFRDWLIGHINTQLNSAGSDGNSSSQQLLTAAEMQSLRALQQQSDSSVLETFKQLVQQSNSWLPDADKVLTMKGILLRLCARYLYLEKRRGLALNPVANFHLTNGAVLWRINFLADTSIRGLNQSCGLMVNYRYYLDDTESNSQNYLLHHRISASPAVLELLQHDLPTGSQNGES
ncbi:malonyl-CoA decarboxylase, mitochondrial-like isoform X2 [Babylonia areolata]